jgi:hypothetical protein
MSIYLDQLIKALENEANEAQAKLRELERGEGRPPKDADGTLKRTLQRIDVLKQMRKREQRRALH